MANARTFLNAAFGALVTSAPYAYTDISDYLRDTGTVAWGATRGRQDVTQKINPGTGGWILDNRRLYFEQLNINSPFSPYVLPEVPIQSGVEYPWLPGLLVDGAFRHGLADWPVLGNVTSAWVQPIDDLAQGMMQLTVTASALAAVESNTISIPVAQRGQKVTCSSKWNMVNGTGRHVHMEVWFFTGIGTGFISSIVGSTQVAILNGPRLRADASGTIPSNAQSMQVFLVIEATGTTGGDIWEVRSAVVDYAGLSLYSIEYAGYADSWICESDVGDNTCTLSATDGIKSLGIQKMNTPFYGSYIGALSPTKWYRFGESIPTQNGITTLTFKDQVSGNRDASVDIGDLPAPGAVTNQTNPLVGRGPLAGIAGCSPLDTDFGFSFIGPSSSDGGCIKLPPTFQPTQTNWTMVWWMRSTDGRIRMDTEGQYDFSILEINGYLNTPANGDIAYPHFGCAVELDSGLLYFDIENGGHTKYIDKTYFNQNIVVDALWHMIGIGCDGNNIYCWVDGILDQANGIIGGPFTWGAGHNPGTASHFGEPYTLGIDGQVGAYEGDELMLFDGTIMSTMQMSALYVAGKQAYPAEPSCKRADRVFDLASWPASLRNIDTTKGVEVTQVTQPFSKANPVQYLQLVESTEQGLFMIDKQGRGTMVDVETLVTATSQYNAPQFVFGNAAGEIPYESITTSNDDLTLYTQGSASTEQGSSQFADSMDEDRYFIRNVDAAGLLLPTDERAGFVSEWLRALFDTPGTKFTGVVINPYVSESALAAMAAIDIGTVIAVRWRPVGIQYAPSPSRTYGSGTYGSDKYGTVSQSYFEVNVSVQSIGYEGTRKRLRVKYGLSSIYAQRWMQFGDNFSSHNMAI